MTRPYEVSHASKARPPLAHGARPLRQLVRWCSHSALQGPLPPGQPLVSVHSSQLHPRPPAPSLSHTSGAVPEMPPPNFHVRLLPPRLVEAPSLWPASPNFHRRRTSPSTSQPFFSSSPASNPHAALPATQFSSNSPRPIASQGLTLFSLKHFFSNTIATDRLPLPDGPFVATETRRQQLWLGCA